ncbi:Tetraacyldisaccharide 4'-kinase [hydrothermal vent metagenome]|uniref:tetraacyldisaccharide 4'-kinase n=1 Tax=hydrothermal vent metagenome TaxID=652676 RepID=A0A1W1C6B5_9ZZZZ
MTAFFEAMFFSPKWYHYVVMILLVPFSLFYGTLMFLRRVSVSPKDFGIPIVSIGNLQVGGSGKTPFLIALASRYEDVTIVSRGYGRKSSGLVEVSYRGNLLVDVKESGDEAMFIAQSLPNASIIVSEKRNIAIETAKYKGAKIILLDDGFNRVDIKKYEILLEPSVMPNTLPFPAGPLREFAWTKYYADSILKEDSDFKRVVFFENLSKRMLLVTAISNPARLDAFLPENVVGKVYLEDHAYFDESFLEKQMQRYGATTLLVTQKDAVKMCNFKLPLSLMKLKLEIQNEIQTQVDAYVKGYQCVIT